MRVARLLLLGVLVACSPHTTPSEFGVGGPPDANVAVFRSDLRRAWTSFRLGGGLNVVVVDPRLPREVTWSMRTGIDGISSSPVVYHDLVLIDANDHSLYAVDAATGAVRWRYKAESDLMPQPVYDDNVGIVATGTGDSSAYYPPAYVAMDESVDRIEAVNLDTGREIWSSGLAGTGMPTPAIIDGTVIHVDGTGTVLALDARTGAYRWHALTRSIFSMTSVVDGRDGRIYAPGSFSDAVYAWDARDGRLVWERPFAQTYGGMSDEPLASTARLLVGMYLQPLRPGPLGWVVQAGTPAQQHVYALDKRSGRLMWDTLLPSVRGVTPTRNESAIPLIYRERVYIGSALAGIFSALDLTTGHLLWQDRVAGPVRGGIAARDGTLYFGDFGGYLWAVDAASGRTIGRKKEPLQFYVGSPIILNDSLIDGSLDGTVVALPLRSIRDSHD